MSEKIYTILADVIELMESFKYTKNDDSFSNSFFEAELNEDGFFILLANLKELLTKKEKLYTAADLEQKLADTVEKCIDWLIKWGYCDDDVWTEINIPEIVDAITKYK